MRNLLTTLLLSQGVPMLLMGDETGRTQHGNNNAYCQDNALGWFRWQDTVDHADLLRFTRELSAFAASLPQLRDDRFWRATSHLSRGDISWHGVTVGKPDWSSSSHSLAWTLEAASAEDRVHIIANSWWRPLVFDLPPLPVNLQWRRLIDTSRPSPEDIVKRSEATPVTSDRIALPWHTMMVLVPG